MCETFRLTRGETKRQLPKDNRQLYTYIEHIIIGRVIVNAKFDSSRHLDAYSVCKAVYTHADNIPGDRPVSNNTRRLVK